MPNWYKINRILVWTKQVRPSYKYLTYTLDQTKSDPTQMVTATSTDAQSMSSSDVIKFIWAYPVLLDSSWNEWKKLNPNNFQQFEDWTDASSYTDSSSYDVMIKFPRRWYKISTTNDITTFSLTDNPNDSEYYYLPFQRFSSWTDIWTNPIFTNASAFYLWAYKWYNSSWLRSWYWKTITDSQTIWAFAWFARTRWNLRWITEFVQELYLELCFMAIFKTTDAQSAIGAWYTGSSNTVTHTTGWTYNKGMTYWWTNTEQMKFLGIEDWYWNIWEWVNWWSQTSNWVYISIPNEDWSNRTSSYSYTPTWAYKYSSISITSWKFITKVKWDNYMWFTPITTWGSDSTYFPDCAWWSSGSRIAGFGGKWNHDTKCGAFCWIFSGWSSSSGANLGSRLMYLPNWDLSL